MSNYQTPPKFNDRPYRNILHDANSYNFNIVMRAFALSQLDRIKKNHPVEWDKYDDSTITLAATGGTHPFPNRWGDPMQASDAFIRNCTVAYPLGARGIGTDTSGAIISFTVVEPNGMNFFTNLLSAVNKVNSFTKEGILGAFDEVPLLLSFYFGASNDVPELDKCVRHIPFVVTDCNVEVTAVGTTYTVSAAGYASKFNEAYYQQPLFSKITEIHGTTIGEYLGSLISAMNATQEAMEKTATGTKTTLRYHVQPVGAEAEMLFAGKLSAAIKPNANINDLPMTSSSDYQFEPESTTNNATTTIVSSSDNSLTFAEVYNKISAAIKAAAYDPGPNKTAVTVALNAAAKKQGFNDAYRSILFKIAGKESSFDPTKVNPASTATGLFQFVNKTWNGDIVNKVPGALAVPAKNDTRLDLTISANAGALFMQNNINILNGKKLNVDLTSVYIMHFLGSGDGPKLLTGKATTPNVKADTIMPNAARSNPTFFYKNGSADGATPLSDAERRRAQWDRARLLVNSGFSNTDRIMNISSGTTFGNVVEKLVLNSDYTAAALVNLDTEGVKPIIPYFKIYVTVQFNEFNPDKNTYQKDITFNIVGTELLVKTPTGFLGEKKEALAEAVKSRTIRAYNYLFTGKNIDIKNLDINLSNTFKSTLGSYSGFTEFVEANQNSTINKHPNPVWATETATAPTSQRGNMTASMSTLGEEYGKGMTRDFRQTEKIFRELLPYVFSEKNFGGSLLEIDTEILGDPELIPLSESVMTIEQLQKLYDEWNGPEKRGLAVTAPSGFSMQFFLLTLGDPNTRYGASNLLAGYYVFTRITANFKENGEFTMNLLGSKFVLDVVTEEAKNAGDSENQKNQDAKAENNDPVAQIESKNFGISGLNPASFAAGLKTSPLTSGLSNLTPASFADGLKPPSGIASAVNNLYKTPTIPGI